MLRDLLPTRARRLARRVVHSAAPSGARLLVTEEIATLPGSRLETASRRLASPVYLGDGVALCRMLGRLKIYCDTSDFAISPHLLADGYWETWLSQFIARRVRPGMRVVDVGANLGYFTLLMADLVGVEGHVLAIEPHPSMVALLRRSVELNGFSPRVAVCALAAGAEEGATRALWAEDGVPGGAAVKQDIGSPPAGYSSRPIEIVRLDSLTHADPRLDFVKIDAEGAEEAIVAGMSGNMAAGPPALVIEFHPGRYADPGDFLARLASSYGGRIAEVTRSGEAEFVAAARVLAEPREWTLYFGPA